MEKLVWSLLVGRTPSGETEQEQYDDPAGECSKPHNDPPG